MLKNYLLITLRSMMKNKLFIMINIIGIAFGVGCAIVSFFNWEYDYRFDKTHVNRQSIYRINTVRVFNGETTAYGYVPLPLGEIVEQNFKDVSASSRFESFGTNLKLEDNLFPADLAYVDPEFFSMFTFDFTHGSVKSFDQGATLMISEKLARILFGSTDVIGKQVTQMYGTNKSRELVIGGVFVDQPQNSSFYPDAYLHYVNYEEVAGEPGILQNWKYRNTLYIQVDDPTRLSTIHSQLQPYKENNNKVREDFQISSFELDPFAGMARRDQDTDRWSDSKRANNIASVIAPVFMALLILLIACFNMTNTAIALSSRRLKEIGIRKVMGGMQKQLIIQFMGETFLVCLVGFLVGLAFGEILVAGWNDLWGDMKLTTNYRGNYLFVVFLIGVLLFTAILSGGYPAIYISRFEPVSILKGKLKFGGTNLFTRILLVLQYSFSLIGIVFSFAFYQNSIYQKEVDLGYKPNGVICAFVSDKAEFDTYTHELEGNNDITQIAGSKHSILLSRYNDPVKYESEEVEVDIIDVGDHYLEVMGLTLLQGRDFIKDSETDRRESVIITESLARKFNWTDPLGKELIWLDTVKLNVVGVVKDVYTVGFWREMEPMMIRYTAPENYSIVLVNAPADKLKEVNTYMETAWKKIFPNKLYNGSYINEEIAEAAEVNNNIITMFLFLGLVALALSATGLFTLVSLNIIKRMKEIGVRKVLGASTLNIAGILNREFSIMLLLASVAGSVLGWMGSNELMKSIWKYYLPTQVPAIVLSVMIMILISLLAIGFKIYSAANTNPVNTLRSE